MGLDRYNTQKQRLEKLLSISGERDSRMTPKQRREMDILRSAFTMNDEERTLQCTLRIIKHIEELATTDSATDTDLARLFVLKQKILDYDDVENKLTK